MKYSRMEYNKKRWSYKDLEWLKNNYQHLGVTECSKQLNRSKKGIVSKCNLLQLKLSKESKSRLLSKPPTECNVNPDKFYSIRDKEVAYFLGFMWADGYLNSSTNGSNHLITVKILEDDMIKLKPTFDRVGKWNYYVRTYDNAGWRNTETMTTNNKRVFDFLVDNGYDEKSVVSPDKILSKIPNELKSYFFLGLSDGDGCFYYYKPKTGSVQRQFTITSSYEQDWSYMVKLCDDMGIKYKVKLSSSVNPKSGNLNSSSQFRITNKVGIQKLGGYLYKSFDIDGIGLPRKYDKYKLIIDG